MKLVLLGIFVGALAYSPVYMFEKQVEPQLESLKYNYANAEEIANGAAAINPDSSR